ncbi:probable protein phosphatase 2C 40 isoform X2 [Elaeis guineensis]|uniref:protein-serine/threonine phosphatase n=1 Tax=Elaeis guineensis var. tenera TaxID=51953 RepID=A0A8N4ETQ6_ELAGV|nr:probable protein phosphatase 2C 40 isoform X2 [Elaeis guineensis]
MLSKSDGKLNVSFGYQCLGRQGTAYDDNEKVQVCKSSFFCLSGAALSANFTLANTNICNGLIGTGILPSLDSPKTFQRVPSSPSLSSLDVLSSSMQSNTSNLSGFISSQSDCSEWDTSMLKSMSAPSNSEGFLNAMEVEIAGGAAGEDRVQAVCSEENGWLFCAIYDGFNGRDAADFLAGTLYENIRLYLNTLNSKMMTSSVMMPDDFCPDSSLPYLIEGNSFHENMSLEASNVNDMGVAMVQKEEGASDAFKNSVISCLEQALAQAESDFLYMVEQEMDDRPDLVSIGSCVLVVLIHGQDLYSLSLGDSRAILAKTKGINAENLEAIQLTDCHSVDNEAERMRLLSEHPDDLKTISHGKVKGKLKKKLNDALMGILQVPNLLSPPYISTQPSLNIHRISKDDQFVVVASDGLFDFFSNEEVVKMVHSFIITSPSSNPAKFLVEQLMSRAAKGAGLSLEELMDIPAGMRREYHDDVTVIVILLGIDHRTSTASTHQ